MKKLYASTVMKNEHTTGTIKYYQILDEKYGIEIVKQMKNYEPESTRIENITDSKEKINTEDLQKLPYYIETLINKDYTSLANMLYTKDDIYFIGRGIDYALCMEGSLKLKEISYIHSEAYAAGELKHGTISLISEGTPVIVVATSDELYLKTISNAKEVKARGAFVILVTDKEVINEGVYDELISIPKVTEELRPILTIIPLQLISYEVAKLRGNDIDKPKNLAKSVTVE